MTLRATVALLAGLILATMAALIGLAIVAEEAPASAPPPSSAVVWEA